MEFERIGEYAMGLNFTSSDRHDAMNRRMSLMMGAQGEQQAHQAMGRAYSGCDASGRNNQSEFGLMGANGSSGPGTMPGMMGGSAYGPGMMGGDAGGPGERGIQAASAEQGMSTPAAVLLAVIAAAVGAVLFALIAPRLKGRRPTVRTT